MSDKEKEDKHLENIKKNLETYEYQYKKSLGEGGFGDVVQAIKDNRIYAIKLQ